MDGHVVITGEGIVCAVGLDKHAVLTALRERRSGIGPMRYLRSAHHELPVGEVPLSDDDMRRLLGVTDEYVNRTTLMGMLAVRQALADAAIDRAAVCRQSLRVVLVSGTTVAGMDVTERYFRDMQLSDRHLPCLHYHTAGSSTRMIAADTGVFAEYTTVSTACSSAANALVLGANLIKAGQADIVVAGGTEALSLFHLNGFNSLMILDHDRCRPFDRTRAGLNLGEGAAYVVLESETLARRRTADVHAWLSGYGNACDAFHQTASSDNGEGAYRAMAEALRMAGLQPADIQYVNAHGTGTPNNDQSESAALRRVFGAAMPLVSSTKGFTGHATSASGSIEAVICLLALRHQFVPANLGCTEPMEGGVVPTQGEERCFLRHVLCNSFGFGGNDTSLVLSGESVGRARETSGTSETSNPSCPSETSNPSCPSETSNPSCPSETSETSYRIAARVEITSEDDLAGLHDYVRPLEARRMGKLMKSSLLASLKALRAVGLERPDAIITATALGCMENTEKLLVQLTEEGEASLSPTLFMQSTHNTIGSNIAIRTRCHGYNVTYSQDDDSLAWALRDAERLLRTGRYNNILVGLHDATTPLYRSLMQRLGVGGLPSIHSIAMILTCGE